MSAHDVPAATRRGGPAKTASASVTASVDAWPEPDLTLLDHRRSDVPAFSVDVLPAFWRDWVCRSAIGASASVGHVALSLITAAASLLGSMRRVAPAPSWSEPCILWAALVGAPSSGKSPALETALRLLQAVDADLAVVNTGARRLRLEQDRAATERWAEQAREAERTDGPAPALPGRPRFEPRRLVFDDADIESLSRALTGAPGGVLLARDGRGAWLDEMIRDARDGSNRAFWLAAWAARACSVHRKAVPNVRIASVARTNAAAVSILGTLRPDALAATLAGEDDDVVARFLFAWPLRPSFRTLSQMTPPPDDAACAALARLRDLPKVRRDLGLSPEALAPFDAFRRMHYARGDDLDGREADWWGKGSGMVLRLAGVLAFLDWAAASPGTAEPSVVPGWAIGAAIRLWHDYLWPHARAVFRTTGSSVCDRRAQKALRWMHRAQVTDITRTVLRRKALGLACDAAETQRVADALVVAGWLRSLEAAGPPRGRPCVRWAVNPALATAPVA
ncbi:DUF3987 domain-containing protein [Reyranella sp. CPCC 100927]|uniref:DUF3987 domain-containing protein n=1 Tax=Reyranella sp. CPCC 100927 TaxID=2599616 RepID=UPI0011B3A0BA|nr:DUF3987 domain-containing protein [Reyranella sp. CPCC 100927]TWT14035.1 DUF3987 domain-containing protein [Reyranella sp. CPCC 100927]